MANSRRNINKIYHKRDLETRKQAPTDEVYKSHPQRKLHKLWRPSR